MVAVSLTGCAQRWSKPGAGDEEFKLALIRCEAVGFERLPPRPHWTLLSPGYVTGARRHCRKSRCSYVPARYVPPRYGTIDLNDRARDSLVRSCLAEDGWRPVE